jgi:(R,R)-butanediol dehydrogenase/meso-butanediol dehydrogenase/diacetyl reductase
MLTFLTNNHRSSREEFCVRAARWHGRRDIRVDEIEEPDAPPPGWVRIRVDACGICGTDLEEYRDGPIALATTPNPLSRRMVPLTLGHECVGVVEEAGEGVRLEPGTPVAVEGNMTCGTCYWCVRGAYALCPHLATLGQKADGGLAEQLLAPAHLCIPYGAEIPVATAALAEPLAVAVRAVHRAGIAPGSSVAIIGAGTIGLLLVQVARIAGAENVLVVENHEHRRKLALEFGATATTMPADALEAADDLTGGIRFDAAIEAAGNSAAVTSAVELARRGGRTVLLGVFKETFQVPMLDLLLGEKEIVASLSHTHDGDFPEAVRLLSEGKVDVGPLVSDRIALADVVHRGFDELLEHPERHLKILVFPNGIGTNDAGPG